MSKRIFSVFLACVLCFAALAGTLTTASAADSGSCGAVGSSVSWQYDSSSKTLTISGSGKIKDYRDVQIFTDKVPWYNYRGECESLVIEEGVTRIGDYAFSQMTALKTASLPTGLAEIGEHAFYESAVLENCPLPAGLEKIEGYAFYGCTSLRRVDFPEGLREIRQFAYYNSGVEEVVFPDSLTSLGNDDLFGTVPVGSVFFNCKNLESVTFGAGLTETGLNNFSGCTTLRHIDFGTGITTISDRSFSDTFMTTLVIPENVTEIGVLAFSNVPTLTDIYIYNSECKISTVLDDDSPISSADDPFLGSQQTVVFHGHSLSTAQEYAERKGYAFVSIDDCAHANLYEEITSEPTCELAGSKNIICYDCGNVVETAVIDALGHDYVTDSTEDKTLEDGHIYDYQTCARCGEKHTAVTHKQWVEGYYAVSYEGILASEPTCTGTGFGYRQCTVEGCGYKAAVGQIVPALGHNVEEYTSELPATCTEDGSATGVCTRCGETVTETLPAAGHKVDEFTEYPPTCTENGSREGVCSVCGETVTEIIEAPGHNMELVSSAVGEDGHTQELYGCTVCGAQESKTVHTEWVEGYYTDVVISPGTCTSRGHTQRTCSVCGLVEDIYTELSEHERGEGVVTKEPTCTEAGVTSYTCIKCGDVLEVTILPLGHDMSVETVLQEPTCELAGTGQLKCSRCDNATTYEIPALGHNIEGAADYEIVAPATCTEEGTARGTCAGCGKSAEVAIPAAGHSYNDSDVQVTLEPTCTEPGSAVRTCCVCKAQETVELPAKGHSYRYSHHYHVDNDLVNADYLAYFCTECGEEHDELKTSVELQFRLHLNDLRTDSENGWLYDVNYDGYINSHDYAIIKQYKTL